MSRIANNPVTIPPGVDITRDGSLLKIKGSKGTLVESLPAHVSVEIKNGVITVRSNSSDKLANALSGTIRANINNKVTGVSSGFEQRLTLVGVGYRAQAKGNILGLTLGYSHPVDYSVPDGISIETPSQTEIVIKGCDKQLVGQVAANIRAYRPPEPYKGKGIRYADEQIVRKEAKKK